MPRAVCTTSGSNKGKTASKAITSVNGGHRLYRGTEESCPLCVEEMDETDLSFHPCPCGYRICLFCYEQIKLHCASQCPGCRRDYGKPEFSSRPVYSWDTENGHGSSSSSQVSSYSTHAVGGSSHSTASSRGHNAAKLLKSNRKSEDAHAGLPSGATWASQATHKQQEMEREVAEQAVPDVMDDVAWPSLSVSNSHVAAVNKQRAVDQQEQHQSPQQHQQPRQQRRKERAARRSSLSTASSAGPESSCNSVEQMSQDPIVPAEQLALHSRMGAPGFAMDIPRSVTVSTCVQGSSRHVNIPLGGARAEPHPEAPALLSRLSAAVQAGEIDCKEATVHLLTFLRQKEAQQARMQSLLAAGKIPPGFAALHSSLSSNVPPVASTSLHGQNVQGAIAGFSQSPGCANSYPSMLNSSVNPSPSLVRHQPIGKPIGPPGPSRLQYQTEDIGQQTSASEAINQQSLYTGTYSMWSGLPGIDIPKAPYPQPPSIWSHASSSRLDPVAASIAQPPRPATSKPPPPGFGGPQFTGYQSGSFGGAHASCLGRTQAGSIQEGSRYPSNAFGLLEASGANSYGSSSERGTDLSGMYC